MLRALEGYTPEHRQELQHLLNAPPWQAVLRSGLLDEVRAERIAPGKTRNLIDSVVTPLLAVNKARVLGLISRGLTDEDRLLAELGRWPRNLAGRDPQLAFLGLNLTAACNFDPKCIYCNQPWVEDRVGLDGWKRVIAEVTANVDGEGPYIYLTGGEPLVLGEAIWGDTGLVRYATERGAGVNLNTNGVGLTPEVALRLIKAGLLRLHISLDTANEALQNELCGAARFGAILEGIYNVQLARDLVGSPYPVIHTNCVLNNRNLERFPELFAFILAKHKQTADRNDPFYNDLFPHVIPIGGPSNAPLRPTADEFRRFYTDIWDTVTHLWADYQDRLGVPPEKHGTLFGYFSNPFLRVTHRGGLDAYVQASAEGNYGSLALAQHCYVAPTQAALTPDGEQFYCGAHAIRHTCAIGNIQTHGVYENIRAGVAGLAAFPQAAHCSGCALATLYINQSVEARLKSMLAEWLGRTSTAVSPDEATFISD